MPVLYKTLLDYTPASPDYSLASSGNTSLDHSDDLSKYLLASLAISPFHDDPYMKVFEIGESSHKTHLERHEEHIETILNHLDELPLERIEAHGSIQDKRSWNGSHEDINIAAHNMVRPHQKTYNCTEDCKVKFATGTLIEEALSWWNSFAQPIGIEEAYKITWSKFKRLLIKKYCPRTEVKKMEAEFYNLTVKGNDLKTYVKSFQELAVLCPTMVPNSKKLMEVFIGGLPRSIEGNVTASKPQTLEEAITIT
ncbi:reverse transcriptase domain-containing protein [Tanacetum coccineum]